MKVRQYGAIFKACRERSGLKQDELAFELGINQSDVSKIESGRRTPDLALVQSWALTTHAQEVLVAFICGVDGLTMMQQIMDVISSTPIVGTIIRWEGAFQWINIF